MTPPIAFMPPSHLSVLPPLSPPFGTAPTGNVIAASNASALAALKQKYPQKNGVVVFQSSSFPQYKNDAYQLGKALANTTINGQKLHFVNGAGASCMSAFAKGVTEQKGAMLGLSTQHLLSVEKPDASNYKNIVAYNTTEDRVTGFDDFSAYTLVMPGSEGTMAELGQKAFNLAYEYFGKNPHQYQKQIILYDPKREGYFNGFLQQQQAVASAKTTAQALKGKPLAAPQKSVIYTVAHTPQQVVAALNNPAIAWTAAGR